MTWNQLPGAYGLILVRDPIGQCDLCGTPFYDHRDLRAHFATPEHRDAVEAEIAERRAQQKRLAFLHESDDPEIEAHLREVGKRMLKEGRWVVKPNERAGFS